MSVEVTRDRGRPALPRPDAPLALLVSLALALLIALGEIDHLLAQVLDDGATWSPNALSGIGAVFGPGETLDGWEFFADRATSVNDQVDPWLRMYAVVDVMLAATYATLGYLWFHRLRPARLAYVGGALALVGGGLDALENLLIGQGAQLGWLILVLTALKWLALVPAAGLALWTLRSSLGRLPTALYTHRYSALIVIPLAALSLGRGPDLLEQIPDIQRAWADPGGWVDFVAAGVVMSLLGAAALVIGRQRTGHLWHRTCPLWTGRVHPCPEGTCPVDFRRQHWQPPLPLLRLWFAAPLVLIPTAGLLALLGADVRPWRLAAFCAIPLAIGGISLWLRIRWEGDQSRRPTRNPIGQLRFRTTALVGDLLVGILPVIAGLGVIRAFAGPIALNGAGLWSGLLFIAGWFAIIVAWPALAIAHARLEDWGEQRPADFTADTPLERLLVQLTPGMSMDRGVRPTPDPDDSFADFASDVLRGFASQRTAWTVLGIGGVVLVVVGLLPVFLAGNIGVIATFQLALGSLSVMIAASVVLLQPGGAPEVFWPLRIPFAPVTSLLVIAALLSSVVGGTDVHRIRDYEGPTAAATAADRPGLGSLMDTWLRAGRSCAQPLSGSEPVNGNGLNVRPLLMYAAEGGGIRAAYWTSAAIDLVADPASAGSTRAVCRSAMLSSGASGGSVGLSIASVRDPGAAADAVVAISGPEALGAAADGLIVRDGLYAATGVPLPSLRDPSTEGTDWSDRATLIEQAWSRAIPRLDRPFLRPAPEDPGEPRRRAWRFGPAGALVINSTSTTTSCRALISQVSLPGSGTSDCAPGQPAAASTDLIECTGQLRTVTAALLTARFPYVTPSGVVDCQGTANQIVDGGYAENTGVGTLVDLMPRVLARVRQHNDCVLATKPRPSGCATETALRTLIVPVLVYLDNGTGSDLVTRTDGPTLEALVPPLTILRAKGALYSARAQLERARALLATDQLFTTDTEAAMAAAAAVDAWRGNQIAVVYQATRPAIAAPLGWVLSGSSIAAMDSALCDQDAVEDLEFGASRDAENDPQRQAPSTPEAEPTSYGTLDDVRALLPGNAARCRG